MTNILRVRDLAIEFQAAEGLIRAVDGVSFTVPQGKTVALVGESGSGKSVVSQAIMRILPKPHRLPPARYCLWTPINQAHSST